MKGAVLENRLEAYKERDKVGIPLQGREVNFQVDLGFANGQHASNPDSGPLGE